MTTLYLADYYPPTPVPENKTRAIRDAVIARCDHYTLTGEQCASCVAQALTQHRNGVSAAMAVAAGCARADQYAGRRLRRVRLPGDVA